MTPIFQEQANDCMRACVAAILDKRYDTVPDFYKGLKPGQPVDQDTATAMRIWFRWQGLHLIDIAMEAETQEQVMEAMAVSNPGVHYLLVGKNSDGYDHVVICRERHQVWNPSRDWTGLTGPSASGSFHVLLIGMAV